MTAATKRIAAPPPKRDSPAKTRDAMSLERRGERRQEDAHTSRDQGLPGDDGGKGTSGSRAHGGA